MATPCRLLLAEDRKDDADQLRWALAKVSACEVDVVSDGEEARQRLGALAINSSSGLVLPAAILLDLQLTKLGGLEVLKFIREQPALRRIPVIVYSTTEDQAKINEAYDAGANAFVVKPATLEELLKVMRAVSDFWLGVSRQPTAQGAMGPSHTLPGGDGASELGAAPGSAAAKDH